jgi:hypothetical protein
MTEHRLLTLEQVARMRDGSGHSIYGASGSPMYLNCPGSLIPNVLAKDDAGFDAAWGTVAHAVTEVWLNTGRPPTSWLGTKRFVGIDIDEGHVITVDDEMLHHAEQCVDRCEWEPGEQLVEYHVDFSHLTPIPNQGGTLDFAALRPGTATCVDHKFGASPENIVYAEENTQLMLYVIGLWRDPRFAHYNFKDFVLRINQPRLNHFDEWHTTAKRLAEFEDYCRERMAAAWQFDAPRKAGVKQCRFCKVKSSCAALAKMTVDLTEAVFRDNAVSANEMRAFIDRLDGDLGDFEFNYKPVGTLTVEQMSRLLPYRGAVEAWFNAIADDLTRRAMAGDMPTGMKVVESRSHRKWSSEAKARARLVELGLTRQSIVSESLVTPAQSEKLLRQKGIRTKDIPELLHGLVHKPPGRAILVPLSDRRPSVEDVTKLVFEPVAQSTEPDEEL